ncbi:hypothetical protein [Paraburkholderia sacchari]|uniref:hypothetical protein n=1 Tax=Paraburkholderia sacchari TaxID=159450 RepID=UPI003D98439D
MARINQFEALCDDLHRLAVAKGYADKKVGQSTIKKPLTVREVMAKAGLDADAVKPFTGKKPIKPADLPDPPEPTILRHEALKQAIVAHAAAHDNLNSPISEQMLNRVLKMAKAGRLTNDQARRTVEYHSKGLALPTDVMRAVASER